MVTGLFNRYLAFSAVLGMLVWSAPASGQIFPSPPPGSVYRDYSLYIDPNTGRVTTPEAAANFPERVATGEIVLPNPTHYIDGVETANAVKAEMVITLWGGHIGTTPKWFYFNGTHVDIPELQTTPTNGECYASYYNVAVTLPLNSLSWSNSIQGDAGSQTCYGFGWPQWIWYGVILRVYYNPSSVSHPAGQITSPAASSTFGEDPTVSVSTSGGADRVDVLAYYDGYDSDGDGVFQEYHHDYHFINNPLGPQIRNHAGTATGTGPDFQVTWNTTWVPDQAAGSVKLIARIHGSNGLWYVTQPVENLSLYRQGTSVQFYKPANVPEAYWAQFYQGGSKTSTITVPSGAKLSEALSSAFFVRTWNGNDEAFVTPPQDLDFHVLLNSYTISAYPNPTFGRGHSYSYDVVGIPAYALTTGSNTIEFYAKTANDHGIEVAWPGPAVMVRYSGAYGSPQPQQVTLVSPASGATDQTVPSVLLWRKAAGSTAYKLQVALDPSFSSIVFADTTVTDTTRSVAGLLGQTTYYWRVKGKNPGAEGNWSVTRSFSTRSSLAAPTLLSPPNNATGQPTGVLLVWNAVSSATAYTVQFSAESTFTSGLIFTDTSLVDTSRHVLGLAPLATYYWRVKGRGFSGGGPYSAAWRFTTSVSGPNAPTLISPADNAVQVPTTATFSWNPVAGAASYNFQLGSDPTFTSGIIKDIDTLTSPGRVVAGLGAGTRYFWHVRARNASVYGSFSDTWSFTTAIPLPGPVTLLWPVHQGTINASSVQLRWGAVGGSVTRYAIEYALDPGFAFAAHDSTAGDTTLTLSPLMAPRTYYWRVRAGNAGGWGPYSATNSFTVQTTSVQTAAEGIPTHLSLDQNYPNPFNPTTSIRFGLAKAGHVSLEVYSVMGERVATLVDAPLPPGYFSITFDASRLSSGVYFTRLTSSEERIIRRMVLMK